MADVETTIREILAQAADALAQALTATEEGETERADELETQADGFKAKAEKMKSLHEKQKAWTVPVMPASLPQENAGAGEGGDTAGGTMVKTQATNGNPPANPQAEVLAAAQKAAHIMRFGTMVPAVKSVMLSLYGPEYEEKRALQWDGFLKYMRGQDHLITQKHWAVGRSLILTPEYVEQALKAGIDFGALKATMVEASDTLGGYIVPVDFQARVIERLPGITVMRGRAVQSTTDRDRVQIPIATGGDSQYTSAIREVWVDETPAAATSETNATFGLEEVGINTAMAVVPLSKNILEDAGFNLADYLVRQFSQAAAINEDNSFLTGDGAGKPQGILPGSLNALSLGEVNSGAAAALTFTGLLRLMMELDTQYRDKAMWLAEKATYLDIMELEDGTGNYLWTEMRGNNAAPTPNVLRGFPVLQQEAMPSVAADAFPIVFADFSGYEIWDRVGMSVERYNVNPGENLLKYEMRRRLGGQVTEPWKFKVQKVAA